MNLYLDDALTHTTTDAAALDAALVRFKNLGGKRLELRKAPNRRLTLSRWETELFIEVETPGRLDGAVADGWEAAFAAARSYLAGGAVTAPKPARGFLDVVIGEAWHPDCPLCRAAG